MRSASVGTCFGSFGSLVHVRRRTSGSEVDLMRAASGWHVITPLQLWLSEDADVCWGS